MEDSIEEWLDSIQLTEYATLFRGFGFTELSHLYKLNEDLLVDIGITKRGHRTRILQRLPKIAEPTPSPGETTENVEHFLANRASHKSTTGGPLNPATANQHNDDIDTNKDKGDNHNSNSLAKSSRANGDNDGGSGSSSVPKINDILSGLLSVVGEGLNYATNYVVESNKRKQQKKQQLQQEKIYTIIRNRMNISIVRAIKN